MTGASLISALRQKLGAESDGSLSDKLGVSGSTISAWKSLPELSELQVANLVVKAMESAKTKTLSAAIRPIVEFHLIDRADSKQGKKFELFGTTAVNGSKHQYMDGLKKELKANSGLYIFFDSRGHAIYVGKAKRQKLWSEMNNAFNRDRADHQSIRLVTHPERNQPYASCEEKTRQIVKKSVKLHWIAAYFSAYYVEPNLLDDVEAMLVRSFANDLLNKKMERFRQQRNT